MYTSAVGFGDGCHDISAGLSGTFALLRQSGPVSWGKPGSAAQSIAFEPGNTNHALVFGYDKGAAMPLLASAPARRVFVFLGDTTASTWTAKGQSLFDNAVFWATRTRYSITKKILHLNYNPTLTTQGNVLLSSFAGPRWLWNPDPLQLMRDYLADITEASGGYVRWKLAKYGNIPDTLNQWVPITGPEQFHSATFTEQKYIDAYDYAFTTRDFAGAGLRCTALRGVDPVPLKTLFLPRYARLPRALALAGLAATTALSLPVDVLFGRRWADASWHKVFVLEHAGDAQ